MKTKDILIIGAGATIVYLLWKRSEKAKSLQGLAGGSGTIGGTTGTTTTGATTTGAVSSEPEQVYGLNLPASMDLPVLTAGTGTPTEVAVQNGGVVTTPTPAIVTTPALSTNDALGGVINVIPKTDEVLPPKGFPTLSPCEQKWVEYSAMIKYASQQAYELAKADFLSKCEGKVVEPILPSGGVKNPKLQLIEEVSGTPIVVEKTLKEQMYASANGSKPKYIKARLFRGVM